LAKQNGQQSNENCQDNNVNLPEVLSAGGTELDVGAGVVVDTGLGQHGVVLDLGLAKRRAVTGDDDQLGCLFE